MNPEDDARTMVPQRVGVGMAYWSGEEEGVLLAVIDEVRENEGLRDWKKIREVFASRWPASANRSVSSLQMQYHNIKRDAARISASEEFADKNESNDITSVVCYSGPVRYLVMDDLQTSMRGYESHKAAVLRRVRTHVSELDDVDARLREMMHVRVRLRIWCDKAPIVRMYYTCGRLCAQSPQEMKKKLRNLLVRKTPTPSVQDVDVTKTRVRYKWSEEENDALLAARKDSLKENGRPDWFKLEVLYRKRMPNHPDRTMQALKIQCSVLKNRESGVE